jgi:CheY-like chemotaxis protein
VRVYLPRYAGVCEMPVVRPSGVHGIEQLRRGSVLLVEDNEEVAAGVAAVLETFGCDVSHETTADKAFDVLTTGRRFDLVLSDIQMPGRLNGIDLAEKVRGTWPLQRIALMTGYADEFERAQHTGVRILAKPFDIDELRELVES